MNVQPDAWHPCPEEGQWPWKVDGAEVSSWDWLLLKQLGVTCFQGWYPSHLWGGLLHLLSTLPSPTDGVSGDRGLFWEKQISPSIQVSAFLWCAADSMTSVAPSCPQISVWDLIPGPYKLLSPRSVWSPFPQVVFIWCHFPGHSDSKEPACDAGDPGSVPELGRSSGEGNGNPLQYSCLENSMDRGAWQAIAKG